MPSVTSVVAVVAVRSVVAVVAVMVFSIIGNSSLEVNVNDLMAQKSSGADLSQRSLKLTGVVVGETTRIGRNFKAPADATPCTGARLGVAMCPCSGTADEATYWRVVSQVVAAFTTSPQLVLDPLWLSADYQHVIHPAYNADRGPVDIGGARLHVEL